MLTEIVNNSIIFKLIIASLLGAAIGLERGIHGRAAGLRTNLLVSLGSAVFMVLSISIAETYSVDVDNSLLRADPSRIAAQIITGIGFLGAGAILKNGLTVQGLTTAACLWISAAIGMSIGAGYYEIGIATTLISLFALIVLTKLEKTYSKDAYRRLEITTSHKIDISKLIALIERKNLKILYFNKEKDYKNKTLKLLLSIRVSGKGVTDNVSRDIVYDLEQSKFKLDCVKWCHQ